MVRLVFRPYTQLRRSICTSESLRTSTRVSPGFVLARHRSPSFGSQRVRSRFVRPTKSRLRTPWECARFGLKKRRDLPSQNTFFRAALLSLRLTSFDCDSTTRAHVRLLGPCFKTGRVGPDFYSPLWVCRRCRRRSTGRLTGHDRAGLLGENPGTRRRMKARKPTLNTEKSQALITAHPVGRGVLLGPPLAAGGRQEYPRRAVPVKRSIRQRPDGRTTGAGTLFDLRGPTRLTP